MQLFRSLCVKVCVWVNTARHESSLFAIKMQETETVWKFFLDPRGSAIITLACGFKSPRARLSIGIDFQMNTTYFPLCTQCIMSWQAHSHSAQTPNPHFPQIGLIQQIFAIQCTGRKQKCPYSHSYRYYVYVHALPDYTIPGISWVELMYAL